LKEGTESTLKFKKLKRRLKLPDWQVIGILESLWKIGRTSAQAGDIGKYSNEDIAATMEYEGDHDELIKTLVETKWLVEDDQFRLYFNDWSQHIPNYLKANFARHKRKFVDQIVKERDGKPVIAPAVTRPDENLRQEVLDRDQVCQYCGGEARTIDHIIPKIRGGQHVETNLVASCLSCNDKKGTMSVAEFAKHPSAPSYFVLGNENGTANELLSGVPSSQVNPSQVNSSQSNPILGAGVREGPDLDQVRRLANKLLRQKKIERGLSGEDVWRVAWIAALLDESVVTRLVSAVAAGSVRKVKPYVRQVMVKLCEDNGRNYAEVCAGVGPVPAVREVVN